MNITAVTTINYSQELYSVQAETVSSSANEVAALPVETDSTVIGLEDPELPSYSAEPNVVLIKPNNFSNGLAANSLGVNSLTLNGLGVNALSLNGLEAVANAAAGGALGGLSAPEPAPPLRNSIGKAAQERDDENISADTPTQVSGAYLSAAFLDSETVAKIPLETITVFKPAANKPNYVTDSNAGAGGPSDRADGDSLLAFGTANPERSTIEVSNSSVVDI